MFGLLQICEFLNHVPKRWVRSPGIDDQIVEWFKPAQKPNWMSIQEWNALPPTLRARRDFMLDTDVIGPVPAPAGSEGHTMSPSVRLYRAPSS